MRTILLSALLLLFAMPGMAQTKVSMADPESLLTLDVNAKLSAKLASMGYELTSLINVNKPCDYFYANVATVDGAPILTVVDCEQSVLGTKNLGARFSMMGVDDAASLLYFSLIDIVNNPQKGVAAQQDKPKPLFKEEEEEFVPAYDKSQISTNQHNSRYFFSPTSYNLRKGELYYNTIYFLLHDLQYGITDNFSFGMGTSIAAFPFYVTPKYSFRLSEKSSMAIGDLLMIGTYGVDFMSNLFYATYTYGNQFSNITIGLGHLGSKKNDLFMNPVSSPVLNVSAMAHLSPYMYFITENYLTTFTQQFTAERWGQDSLGWDVILESKEFKQEPIFFLGFTGFRFISKRFDVRSFSVGLSYFNLTLPGIPSEYSGSAWRVDYPAVPRIFIPTLSYTYKFGKLF